MLRSHFILLIIGLAIVAGRDLRNELNQKLTQLRFIAPQPKFMSDELPMQPGLPPLLAHIFQYGSNLFYKPQIMFPALAIESPESISEVNKEHSDNNFVIEAADPQSDNPIKPIEDVSFEDDTEVQCVPEPPELPTQFIEAEQISEPLIIAPSRPLTPVELPERPPTIFMETSPHVSETETEKFTPIKIPAAPTLPPFETPKIPILVPIRGEPENEKEECITPTQILGEKQREISQAPIPVPTRFCIVCTDNN